jgi:hypothetical protein
VTAEDRAVLVTVAHRGPIEPGCPLECLRTVVSLMAWNRLKWELDSPRTVGQVLELYRQGKLGDIRGLGPRRISEIGTALVFAGLDIRGQDHRSG